MAVVVVVVVMAATDGVGSIAMVTIKTAQNTGSVATRRLRIVLFFATQEILRAVSRRAAPLRLAHAAAAAAAAAPQRRPAAGDARARRRRRRWWWWW